VTVVGDDDQAIYKFRGAALANILRFRVDFPIAVKVVLVRNYRSGASILDAAYRLIINNNPHRLEVTEGLSKKLVSHAEDLGFVHHVHCATLEDEIESTVSTILQLRDEKGSDWSDFAILVRGNDSADPFIEALDRAAVPFRFMAMSGLYTKPIVLDCLSYLRVVDLPFNSPAMYRIISHPRLGISEKDLSELMMYVKRKGLALCDAMRSASMAFGVSMEGKQRMLEILDTLAKLRERAKRLPVTELFVEVLKTTGLLADCQSYTEIEQQEIFRQLDRFLSRLKRFAQANDDKALARFIEEFDAEREAGEDGGLGQDPEDGPDVVSIMTVHGAKGLEFKHVFVVNLVEQRFPSQARGSGIDFPPGLVAENAELDDHVAEERRLFYVAITRAKESLYLMSADDYGGARKKKISRFLTELGYSATATSATAPTANSILDATSGDEPDTRSVNTDLPDRISFSQIAAFSTCPLQYKYAHIIKVPSFGRHVLSFGKTMHNALQRFMEAIMASHAVVQSTLFGAGVAPELPTQADLMRMYDDAWIDEWYPDDEKREEYREKGRESLREFYRLASLNAPRPYALEKGFTLKLGDVLVKGRIDRIDTCDGGYEIIDYKTGSPKDKLVWDDRRQLILYALALEQCFDPPLQVKRCTYYYLESNTVVNFEPSQKEKEKLTQEILDTMEKIRTSSFAATPGMHCQYCDFKDICPFRQ
ncbi:MAG: ATP-dependent helicase, partial [Candidatus Uhrbacteria bacterium]|nr:ATP-dependent helicase [Candidatus Uhrbacteria bacterium]